MPSGTATLRERKIKIACFIFWKLPGCVGCLGYNLTIVLLSGLLMPSISMFYGLIVYMYFKDNKQHKSPHIHVKYQDHEVVVQIPDGTVLDGSIPPAKMKLLQAWVELHQEELMADWNLAVSGEQPYKINPLH